MNRLRRNKKQSTTAAASSPSVTSNTGTNASPTANATTPPASSNDDVFEARRSARASSSVTADGDTWQEILAVCEVGGKATVRSYYTNQRSGQRVWDEPPSGASNVVQATEEMRRMANVQLQEMEITMGAIGEKEEEQPKTMTGRLFGKKKKLSSGGIVQYKSNSFLNRKNQKKQPRGDEVMDPDVQEAIALSMAEQSGVADSSYNRNQKANEWQEEQDEELAMAKALSLSEGQADAKQSEQEMDLLGISQPTADTATSAAVGVASMPNESVEDDANVLVTIPPSPPHRPANTNDAAINAGLDLLDSKPPASDLLDTTKPSSADLIDTEPPVAASQPTNRKSWPPPQEGDHALQKISPEQGQRKSRIASMTRRLSKKGVVEDKAGVV